jgi:hypothetical protein
VNEAALTFAAHDTLTDFSVDDVAVAVTEVGAARAEAAADTVTAFEVVFVVPSPSCPHLLSPQHLIVVSVNSAHVCVYPAEICVTPPVIPLTAIGTIWFAVEATPT